MPTPGLVRPVNPDVTGIDGSADYPGLLKGMTGRGGQSSNSGLRVGYNEGMGKHPLNLALRFLLELLGLFALGYWGWTQHAGWPRLLWTVGPPLVAAVLWGTFRVPDDPGPAPVPVPGFARLTLEATYFGAAVWAFYAAGRESWAWVLGGLVVFHYLISYDRLAWMLKR